MSVNPRNPTIPKGAEIPARGETRPTVNGRLEWFDISTHAWRPAVHHHQIRSRLLRQAKAAEGAYVHPRGQGTGNNETAPLREDLNYGHDWANRPALLFQLKPDKNQRCVEPTGIMLYHSRVVLDPFDHPIRDFERDLPVTISTELKGDEVEYYLRKNLAIKVYDLVARMLNGYTIINRTYAGPPRILSIRERATKFREKSGCLAWTRRDGSTPINDYILSLLPAGATTTRALGGDLTPQQIVLRKAGNKGKYGNRRRKAKRAIKPQEDQEEDTIKEEDTSEDERNPFGDSKRDDVGEKNQTPEARGRKRGISEASSDANAEDGDETAKRPKLKADHEIDTDEFDHVSITPKQPKRKSAVPASSTNLNQGVAAKAAGRATRATKVIGSRRRKAHDVSTQQGSNSEREDLRDASSSPGGRRSSSFSDANPSDQTSGDASPVNAGHGAKASSETDDSVADAPPVDPDMRNLAPSNRREVKELRRAVQITLADFAVRVGYDVKQMDQLYDLTLHQRESYMSQHYFIQQKFRAMGHTASLFYLSEWSGTYEDWLIEEEDDRGPWLLSLMRGDS